MNKLYIAYYYNPENEKDAFVFVGRDDEDRNEACKEVFKLENGMDLHEDDISGVYEVGEVKDKNGNVYKLEVKK